jgi:hypothetical protein
MNKENRELLSKALYAIEKNETVFEGFEENEADEMINLLNSLPELIKELQHYKDSSIGLWCTDRPTEIKDPKNLMFRLK